MLEPATGSVSFADYDDFIAELDMRLAQEWQRAARERHSRAVLRIWSPRRDAPAT